MKPFFKDLFEYSHHTNQKLAELFTASHEKTSEKSVTLYNHILNAHQIWNSRIDPASPPYGVWEIHPAGEYQRIDRMNYENSIRILETLYFDQPVSYTNSKGQPYTNTVRDILFHVINHSTYHRGQIAAEFREHGLEPLVTDYIFYKR
ncbi:MAG: DinB family protein [Cytophagales bacterium]|nr:DinB family protein [Cytophagales bacterium]